MRLIWPWLPPTVLAGGAAIAILWVVLGRRDRRQNTTDRLVAHTRELRTAPLYRRAMTAYRTWLALSLVVTIGAIAVCAVIAARPVDATTYTPETRNRDIVLCLDVSISMTSSTANVIESFDRLASEFQGERLALVLFDGSPLQVFPLTTDYGYVRAQLDLVRADLRGQQSTFDHRAGTRVGNGSSRIGDGVAGCLLQFDRLDEPRSRSVVLATDYRAVSSPLVTADRAAGVAVERGVSIFGLNAEHRNGQEASVAFERDVVSTGGVYFPTSSAADSAAAVRVVVDRVLADPATAVAQAPVRTVTDTPDGATWLLAVLTITLLGALWRLRL